MTITITAENPRSIRAIEIAAGASQWLKCHTRDGRKVYGVPSRSKSGLYHLVLNKYYVDEVYQQSVVDPVVEGSTKVLWQSVDVGVIDATVNGSAILAKTLSGEARRMQSGNIRSYGAWVAVGAAALIAYMLWIGALVR